ncbi:MULTISPECIES: zinc-dependent alcohol dehydrogenase family protein [unclassified Halomonas]|uniref:zinc-dependent alcohol dehydrogenase family protein n=1 Tax=unclassified Halomonas TaxID=2609666 RepID=UPI0021E3B2C5|nr:MULTISPECIES: NAD(P)-dependent alcohol dehydrogenase [unclassified Halomonas]UYF98965.1 NAD(P)-dependent alcohol dehydrogenase [Halomonas sp. GD1P12]WNL39915.1 NAD(P)-dependent alcohol dehydrogenase [Halomonas sp. PAMB 3232]WNL43223.1 NAD(P)-dependent alcohol dehydrogenase [Halomonas sp. PAMB 3264]
MSNRTVTLKAPGGLDQLGVFEREAPNAPGAGEILVRIHASSLNFHDYAVVAGMIPTDDGRIPMSDGAGVVEAVGEGVTEFAVGDRVVSTFFPTWLEGPARVGDFRTTPGDGVDGYAREQITRPATWFTHQPEGYSHAEAATLTTAGLTAWRALVVDGGLKAGDTVLVLGTGGVSIFALQFAKMMGARVIATSSSDEKLEKLKALGAEHVINYQKTPEWGKKVKELTGGEGVDHIVEVGGPKTLPQSIDAVKIGGHMALIGILTGREGDIPTAKLMAKQATLKGLIVGSRRDQLEMIRAIEASHLRPIIDREFGLEEIGDAFRHQESGQHFGKICLSF